MYSYWRPFNIGMLVITHACLFVGCDGTDAPPVNYVEGVVTLDGQPIEGVLVNFSSVSGTSSATGTTNAQGIFKLTALPDGPVDGGAEAGEYNVTFIKSETVSSTPSVQAGDPNYGKTSPSSGGPPKPPEVVHIVPVKYNTPATSGFKVTVKQGQNTGDEFKFDLASK